MKGEDDIKLQAVIEILTAHMERAEHANAELGSSNDWFLGYIAACQCCIQLIQMPSK